MAETKGSKKEAHFFFSAFWIDLDFPTVVFRGEETKSTMLSLVVGHRLMRQVWRLAFLTGKPRISGSLVVQCGWKKGMSWHTDV